MSEKFFCLGVKAYDFKNDQGEQLRGMKVIYLDQPEDTPMLKGYLPLMAPAAFEVLPAFHAKPFPSIFELSFRQRPDSKTGKPTLTVTKAEFIEKADCCLPLEG